MRATFVALAVLTTPAFAQEPPPAYQDDRSSATALIESLYNAIDRQEYLRAWSYFGENAYAAATDASTADYETFKKGYAETKFVTLLTGTETQDGAAGSTYYTVPTAIDAVDASGKHTQFAGCYTIRLAQPAIQDAPPFHPLHIEKGEMKPAKGELETILPKTCTE